MKRYEQMQPSTRTTFLPDSECGPGRRRSNGHGLSAYVAVLCSPKAGIFGVGGRTFCVRDGRKSIDWRSVIPVEI